MAQYRSQLEWMSSAHIEQFYKEGGRRLQVYSNLTEYGCGPTLQRHYRCWCTDELNKKKEIEKQKKLDETRIKKAELLRKIARKVNLTIKDTSKAGAQAKASRWGK